MYMYQSSSYPSPICPGWSLVLPFLTESLTLGISSPFPFLCSFTFLSILHYICITYTFVYLLLILPTTITCPSPLARPSIRRSVFPRPSATDLKFCIFSSLSLLHLNILHTSDSDPPPYHHITSSKYSVLPSLPVPFHPIQLAHSSSPYYCLLFTSFLLFTFYFSLFFLLPFFYSFIPHPFNFHPFRSPFIHQFFVLFIRESAVPHLSPCFFFSLHLTKLVLNKLGNHHFCPIFL